MGPGPLTRRGTRTRYRFPRSSRPRKFAEQQTAPRAGPAQAGTLNQLATMRAARWLWGAVGLSLGLSRAQAQVQASVETGLGGMQYQGNPGAIASLAPSFSWSSSFLRMSAEGTYTGFGDDREGTAGRVNGSLFGRLGAGFLAEGFGTATGQTGPRLSEGAWLAGARLHYMRGVQGLWLGG